MRGRSASFTAFQAASMSWLLVRARPQMIGPSTSRAIACTDSKSPGEVIGKPASITSTPRRASWWAISSFSALLSEIPGDCSPSRRVVSKTRTRFSSLRSRSLMPFLFLSSQVLPSPNSVCGCCGRHALFPPKGEEEKSQGEKERHARPRLHSEHNLADVLALGHEAVRVGAALERDRLGHHRPDRAVTDQIEERLAVVAHQRAPVLPD